MFDADQFAERAAIMEFDGGLSRFEAETQAAKAQGISRWEALNEIGKRHSATASNHGAADAGQRADNVSRMQRHPAQQAGSVPERRISA